MGEIREWFDEYSAAKKKERDENYQRALSTYEQAQELAHLNGFELQKHSPWHFILAYKPKGHTTWLYNLYPANQRIYTDPHHRGPFLEIAKPWTFLDVVCAAMRKAKPKKELQKSIGVK